jgi:hypothetical protein
LADEPDSDDEYDDFPIPPEAYDFNWRTQTDVWGE